MSKDEDKLLIEQIEAGAELAKDTNRTDADLDGMAAMFSSQFSHRSEGEILELLKSAWRRQGLFWAGM